MIDQGYRWRIAAALCGTLTLATAAVADPGDLDPAFWGSGVYDFSPTSIGFNLPCQAGPMAVGANGTILVVANTSYPTSCDLALHAVTEDSQTLIPIEEQGGFLPWLGAMAAAPDGRWVLASTVPHPRYASKSCIVVQRLTADYGLDPTFAGDGIAWGFCGLDDDFGDGLRVNGVAVGAGGTIYVVGQTASYTGYQAFLEVFAASGASHHFHDDLFFEPMAKPNHSLTEIVVRPEPRGETLWVAGRLDARWYGENGYRVLVARLDSYGNYAPGFGGLRSFGPDPFWHLAGLSLAPDGGAFVGISSECMVIRLLPDGTNNTSFGFLGFTFLDFVPGVDGEWLQDLVWANRPGRLYALGRSEVDGESHVVVRALTATASADTTFGGLGTGTAVLPRPELPGALAFPSAGIAADGTRLVVGARWYASGPYMGSSQNITRLFRLLR